MWTVFVHIPLCILYLLSSVVPVECFGPCFNQVRNFLMDPFEVFLYVLYGIPFQVFIYIFFEGDILFLSYTENTISGHAAHVRGQFFTFHLLQLGSVSHRFEAQDVSTAVMDLTESVIIIGGNSFHQRRLLAFVF